jgi:NAD(P)-dependent dehydrogenase (short-subunit alcohol dehydrogenase family)
MANTEKEVLAGRRAVVTGGSKGIGLSIALALAGAGADVAVSARGLEELEQAAAQIQALGRQGLAIPCDVTAPTEIEHLAATVLGQWGGVDILVNSAGGAGSHKFVDHPDELWHRMLSLNLTSTYYVTKAFVPAMIEQRWGRIINMASIASKIGGRYIAAYTAAKHGVLGLTRALALEFVSYQITVNAICPGYVDTPMTDASIANIVERTHMPEAEARAALEKTSPQKRLIEPEEVAAVALLLAQEISKGITGQAINVDGGTVMA